MSFGWLLHENEAFAAYCLRQIGCQNSKVLVVQTETTLYKILVAKTRKQDKKCRLNKEMRGGILNSYKRES